MFNISTLHSVPLKAVVEVDHPMKALSMHIQNLLGENSKALLGGNWINYHSCHFVKNYFI